MADVKITFSVPGTKEVYVMLQKEPLRVSATTARVSRDLKELQDKGLAEYDHIEGVLKLKTDNV